MNNPAVKEALNRISIAKREEAPKSVVVTSETYRILQRYLIGNIAETCEMLARIADSVLREAQENTLGSQREPPEKLLRDAQNSCQLTEQDRRSRT